METMGSFAGTSAPDVAVLSRRPSDGATAGAVRDASTGDLINRIFFHSSFVPVDLEVVPNFGGTGADELVVLGQHVDDDRIAGGVRDAASDVLLKRVFFDEPGRDHQPLDIEVLTNFGDTSAPELVMMGQRASDNDIIAEVRDASTGTLLSTVSFDDTYAALDLEVVPNFGGTAAKELVMLGYRESDGSIIGEVRDASSGALLQSVTFTYSVGFVPKGIEVLPNFGGTGARELAVHSVRTSDGAVRAEVHDASSGVWLKNITFTSTYEIP
jgi:predicted secreted protein